MALARDSSSPAAFKVTPGTSITSASFTPPAGSLIRFSICHAYGGATDPTMSSTGGGLGSWRQVKKLASGAFAGANCTVYIYEAPVNSSVATTVKADFTSTGSFDVFGWVDVWTGQASDQSTCATASGTASGSPVTPYNTTGMATTANNSRVHGVSGMDASGTLGSSDTGSGQTGTNDGGIAAYKASDTATSGTSVSLNYTNTGNPGHIIWVTAEILTSNALSITPPQGAAALTGQAPTVINSGVPVPASGTLTAAGRAPVLALTMLGAVGAASFTGYAPSLSVASGRTITPSSGALTFTGTIPNQGTTATPAAGTASFSGLVPNLVLGTTGGSITPNQADLSLVGYVPMQVLTVAPIPNGDLSFVGYAPGIGGNAVPAPPAGTLAFQGYAPLSGLQGAAGALNWQGQTPQLITGFLQVPTAGAASFAGAAVTVTRQTYSISTQGAVTFAGAAPTLVPSNFSPPGRLSFQGYAPTIPGGALNYHFGFLFPVDGLGRVPTIDHAQSQAPYTTMNGFLIDASGRLVTGVGPDPSEWQNSMQLDTGYLVITTSPTLPLNGDDSGFLFDANGALYVITGIANPIYQNGLPFDRATGALVIV